MKTHLLSFFSITLKFIRHNLTLFSSNRPRRNDDPIILMELNNLFSAHISYSYLGNVLANTSGAQLKAYNGNVFRNWLRRALFRAAATIGWKHFGVYRSFGVSEFFGIQLSGEQRNRAQALCADVLKKIRNKRDIEELRLDGIWVGDLIYTILF